MKNRKPQFTPSFPRFARAVQNMIKLPKKTTFLEMSGDAMELKSRNFRKERLGPNFNFVAKFGRELCEDENSKNKKNRPKNPILGAVMRYELRLPKGTFGVPN